MRAIIRAAPVVQLRRLSGLIAWPVQQPFAL